MKMATQRGLDCGIPMVNLWVIYSESIVNLWFTGWWYPYPSEKYEGSSIGMMTFATYGKIEAVFQTTDHENQVFFVDKTMIQNNQKPTMIGNGLYIPPIKMVMTGR